MGSFKFKVPWDESKNPFPAWIVLFERLQEVHSFGQARVGSEADLRLMDDGSIGTPSFWEGWDALVEVAAIMPGQADHDGGTVVLINELQQVSSAVHILLQRHAVVCTKESQMV